MCQGLPRLCVDIFENAKEALDILGTQSDSDQVAVLDIGSNDGTQLEQFQKLGCRVLGVESAQKHRTIRKR